jgi:hypothetical protein
VNRWQAADFGQGLRLSGKFLPMQNRRQAICRQLTDI